MRGGARRGAESSGSTHSGPSDKNGGGEEKMVPRLEANGKRNRLFVYVGGGGGGGEKSK